MDTPNGCYEHEHVDKPKSRQVRCICDAIIGWSAFRGTLQWTHVDGPTKGSSECFLDGSDQKAEPADLDDLLADARV